ncbi:MAG: exodeoxyribonuclease III [Pseudomonadota bacterium]|nr:exodeoxyribonuclease III [Pseudomonadota bacterium]
MKIATWNVNSLKVRMPHLLDWLGSAAPDVIALQETKTEDAAFPRAPIEAAGWHVAFSGQKTYNGVALLSRRPGSHVQAGMPGFADEQKRVIAASYGDVRVIGAYVPNGQAVGSDKYEYKLRWLEAFTAYLRSELERWPRLVVVGDYNIAPEDRDVHDPKAWEGSVLVSPAERAAFRGLLGLGLHDAMRLFAQPDGTYTWWDYRAAGFRRNLGLRIDHILASAALAAECQACTVDVAPRKLERPSDHAPVWAEFTPAPALP